MTGNELRQRFLDFFKERDHTVVPSSSLLPDDPSVLLTTAGMQQFKPYYTGELDPETTRHPNLNGPVGRNAVSVQKSFRMSDIDEVGDESHLTFFEMLGSFSFGGYFKEESIRLGYEFIVRELGLDIDYVTIFEGDDDVPRDDESEAIWKSVDSSIEVRHAGREDNFWGPTGVEGPCGPTTEIFVNDPEIWSHVFNEFYCHKDNTLEKLKTPGVDTGMGFERLAQVVQEVDNVFEIDVTKPLMNRLAGMMSKEGVPDTAFDMLFRPGQAFDEEVEKAVEKSKKLRALRIIADHMKGSVFLAADGIRPSNQDQGYILRRLLRRAIHEAQQLDISDNFYTRLIDDVVAIYGEVYPNILEHHDEIAVVIDEEAKKFGKALRKGERVFEKMVKGLPDDDAISGEQAFDLYQSYGFPIELTEEMAAEEGRSVDREGFEKALIEHRETSKKGSEVKFGGHGLLLDTGEVKAGDEEGVTRATKLHTATHLLHAALREALGDHVQQQGSDITPDRLRFDFTHSGAMTDEEKKKVEDMVNDIIAKDLPVRQEEISYEEAMKQGALAFFREKYPEVVSVYTVGDKDKFFSKECCGGPHVKSTGEIGGIEITKEKSSSAGVRRIRARLKKK